MRTPTELQDQCLVVQISYVIMKLIQAFHYLLMSLQECCKMCRPHHLHIWFDANSDHTVTTVQSGACQVSFNLHIPRSGRTPLLSVASNAVWFPCSDSCAIISLWQKPSCGVLLPSPGVNRRWQHRAALIWAILGRVRGRKVHM